MCRHLVWFFFLNCQKKCYISHLFTYSNLNLRPCSYIVIKSGLTGQGNSNLLIFRWRNPVKRLTYQHSVKLKVNTVLNSKQSILEPVSTFIRVHGSKFNFIQYQEKLFLKTSACPSFVIARIPHYWGKVMQWESTNNVFVYNGRWTEEWWIYKLSLR